MSAHYSIEDLEEYFQEQLSSDEETAALEVHLADCAACAARARTVYRRSSLAANLSAARHGEAFWRERLQQEPASFLGAVRVSRRRGAGFLTEVLSWLLPQEPLFPLLAPEAAIPTSGGPAVAHSLLLGQLDGPKANVELEPHRLRVLFTDIPRGQKPPAVLLIDATGPQSSRAAPRWDDLHERWVAELEDPPEEYLIAFAPWDE